MNIKITKVPLADLGDMRKKFLDIINAQFTYDKCHLFGWADTYLFVVDDYVAGYGSVWGKDNRKDRDSIFEFYLQPDFIKDAHAIFKQFIEASKVSWIECQSNDPFLSDVFFEFADGISESSKWNHEYVLKHHDQIVGSGGLMLNYNFPYADIYDGIEEKHRRNGFGSLFVQELKKETYRIGLVPAARTNIDNTISKRTMMKAGLKPCGWRLGGKIREEYNFQK